MRPGFTPSHTWTGYPHHPLGTRALVARNSPCIFRTVRLHDSSYIRLRNLGNDYNPTDKLAALKRLQRAQETGEFITGLIYYNPDRPSLAELEELHAPLTQLPPERLRPSPAALEQCRRPTAKLQPAAQPVGQDPQVFPCKRG